MLLHPQQGSYGEDRFLFSRPVLPSSSDGSAVTGEAQLAHRGSRQDKCLLSGAHMLGGSAGDLDVCMDDFSSLRALELGELAGDADSLIDLPSGLTSILCQAMPLAPAAATPAPEAAAPKRTPLASRKCPSLALANAGVRKPSSPNGGKGRVSSVPSAGVESALAAMAQLCQKPKAQEQEEASEVTVGSSHDSDEAMQVSGVAVGRLWGPHLRSPALPCPACDWIDRYTWLGSLFAHRCLARFCSSVCLIADAC